MGTGFGTAFYLFFANRSGDVAAIAVVSRLVVRADVWFTTPAVIFQPLSGLWLAQAGGWPLSTGWLVAALLLFALAGACWLPVLWLQLRMRDIAGACAAVGEQPAAALPASGATLGVAGLSGLRGDAAGVLADGGQT